MLNPQTRYNRFLFFDDKIQHVLHVSNNIFLIICEQSVYILNANFAILKEKIIELEKSPKKIISGTILNKKKFLIHTKAQNSIIDARVYNLDGKLISIIEIPKYM